MTESASGLVCAMVRGGAAHSARERQRWQRLRVSEEPDGLVDSDRAFLRADSRVAGKNQDAAAHLASQFLDKSRVEYGVLPGQIQLANDGSARGGIVIFFSSERGKSNENGEKQRSGKGKEHLWQL